MVPLMRVSSVSGKGLRTLQYALQSAAQVITMKDTVQHSHSHSHSHSMMTMNDSDNAVMLSCLDSFLPSSSSSSSSPSSPSLEGIGDIPKSTMCRRTDCDDLEDDAAGGTGAAGDDDGDDGDDSVNVCECGRMLVVLCSLRCGQVHEGMTLYLGPFAHDDDDNDDDNGDGDGAGFMMCTVLSFRTLDRVPVPCARAPQMLSMCIAFSDDDNDDQHDDHDDDANANEQRQRHKRWRWRWPSIMHVRKHVRGRALMSENLLSEAKSSTTMTMMMMTMATMTMMVCDITVRVTSLVCSGESV